MLSTEVIRSLAKGEGNTYLFDFSTIPSPHYESLFRTLLDFLKTNGQIIGFNCDELACITDRTNIPDNIKTSIAKKKTNYIKNMVELLSHVIPRSTTITELIISNIVLYPEHIKKLSGSFARSNILRKLTFNKVPLGDQGIQMLVGSLDPNKIESIIIKDCGVTSASTESIIAFINRRISKNDGIKVFDIDEQDMVPSDIRKIKALINNQNEQREATQKPVPSTPPREDFPEDNMDQDDAISREIAALREENSMLRNQIKALSEMKASAELSGSIFVVGTGGPQFVNYLGDIEDKLLEIDRNTRFM